MLSVDIVCKILLQRWHTENGLMKKEIIHIQSHMGPPEQKVKESNIHPPSQEAGGVPKRGYPCLCLCTRKNKTEATANRNTHKKKNNNETTPQTKQNRQVTPSCASCSFLRSCQKSQSWNSFNPFPIVNWVSAGVPTPSDSGKTSQLKTSILHLQPSSDEIETLLQMQKRIYALNL